MSILNNEITTPRQAKNGTRAFLCSRTGATYTSYASGYVCRQKSKVHASYQLNKKYKIKIDKTSYTSTKRVLIPNESDRLALIVKRSQTWKG
tara:strand:- start:2822 stop:3097 length:276 start_codon:yes stop_codon:yes gene_type:complete